MYEGKRERVEHLRRTEPDELGPPGDDVGPEAFAIALAQHTVDTVARHQDVGVAGLSGAGYIGVEVGVDTAVARSVRMSSTVARWRPQAQPFLPMRIMPVNR